MSTDFYRCAGTRRVAAIAVMTVGERLQRFDYYPFISDCVGFR